MVMDRTASVQSAVCTTLPSDNWINSDFIGKKHGYPTAGGRQILDRALHGKGLLHLAAGGDPRYGILRGIAIRAVRHHQIAAGAIIIGHRLHFAVFQHRLQLSPFTAGNAYHTGCCPDRLCPAPGCRAGQSWHKAPCPLHALNKALAASVHPYCSWRQKRLDCRCPEWQYWSQSHRTECISSYPRGSWRSPSNIAAFIRRLSGVDRLAVIRHIGAQQAGLALNLIQLVTTGIQL